MKLSLCRLATLLVLIVFTSACNNKNNETEEELPPLSLLSAIETNSFRKEFEYDDNNRLVKITNIYLEYKEVINKKSIQLVYDEQGGLYKTIESNPYKNSYEDVVIYRHEGDTIFVGKSSQDGIKDTLFVRDEELKEVRDGFYPTIYQYKSAKTLSLKKDIYEDVVTSTKYTYDETKDGLMTNVRVPLWFVVYNDMFEILYSDNLCTQLKLQEFIVENGVITNSSSETIISLNYEFDENGRALKMIDNTQFLNNGINEYYFKYIEKTQNHGLFYNIFRFFVK